MLGPCVYFMFLNSMYVTDIMSLGAMILCWYFIWVWVLVSSPVPHSICVAAGICPFLYRDGSLRSDENGFLIIILIIVIIMSETSKHLIIIGGFCLWFFRFLLFTMFLSSVIPTPWTHMVLDVLSCYLIWLIDSTFLRICAVPRIADLWRL